MAKPPAMIDETIGWARAAGQVLLSHFGRTSGALQKSDLSNVVTAADLASERTIVQAIRQRHPTHSIIAEEHGCDLRDGAFTWVVDPLDGTSNFVAGIPWFGVLIALPWSTAARASGTHRSADGHRQGGRRLVHARRS